MGTGLDQQSEASHLSSVVRLRELEAKLALKRQQAAQNRVAGDERLRLSSVALDEAEIAMFEAQKALEIARSSNSRSYARSSKLHAGSRAQAAEQRPPNVETPVVRQMIAPPADNAASNSSKGWAICGQ